MKVHKETEIVAHDDQVHPSFVGLLEGSDGATASIGDAEAEFMIARLGEQ
jgi:hypothetical protein